MDGRRVVLVLVEVASVVVVERGRLVLGDDRSVLVALPTGLVVVAVEAEEMSPSPFGLVT
ncbi:MAG: hypothetical protein HYX32_13585 [Actinobacteria bacterium]|nr:hypothetical protein [Actinomycetota bacterium]